MTSVAVKFCSFEEGPIEGLKCDGLEVLNHTAAYSIPDNLWQMFYSPGQMDNIRKAISDRLAFKEEMSPLRSCL